MSRKIARAHITKTHITKSHFALAALSAFALASSVDARPARTATVKTATAKADLKVVSIDADGGAAMLFVTPEGKSLLIDTGWPLGMGAPRGNPTLPSGKPAPFPSTADKIAAAAASLGVKKIDYLLMTHYHIDHVGGLQALLAKMPVGTFIDHGPNREEPPPNATPRQLATATATLYPGWVAAYQGHEHITATVGQTLDIGSLHLQFVTSDGKVPEAPLPGAGQPNPSCSGVPHHAHTGGEENVRSVGTILTFGKTRILDLGDLNWDKEIELFCPVNKIGPVDLYIVTGHGMDLSSSPPTVAIDPLVAVMQNGAMKGGDASVLNTIHAYPDLQGLWMQHYSVRNPTLNGDPNYIANLDWVPDQFYPITIDITPAGKITVVNGRNNFTKTYFARAAQP